MTDEELEVAINDLKAQPGTTDPKIVTILEGLLAAVNRRTTEDDVQSLIMTLG